MTLHIHLRKASYQLTALAGAVFLWLAPQLSEAQLPPPDLSLEAGIGLNTYQGELSQFAQQWNGQVTAALRYTRLARFQPGLAFFAGAASGQDYTFLGNDPGLIPNRSVKTQLMGLIADVQWNLVAREAFSVYLSGGPGFLRFTPQNDQGQDLIDQSETRSESETYAQNTFMVPVALGTHYRFPNGFGVGFRVRYYALFTDYLDNISELGPSPNDADALLSWQLYGSFPLTFEQRKR